MSDHNPSDFYATVPCHDDFEVLADSATYTALPDDWWLGTSDIIGSTRAIAQGRYKAVNMVGAAVISAQINAHKGAAFPFIFGGDGAGFAVPPEWRDRAATALSATRHWAHAEFNLDLRVGMVQVRDIRAAGMEIAVARFQAASAVDYAMFSGGGLSWAEAQMKSGAHDLPRAPEGSQPDLEGLSCRWSRLPSQHGVILSVVIVPAPDAPAPAFAALALQVLTLARGLERAGTPVRPEGPAVKWPPEGATLEAHAQRGDGPLGPARRKALFESFVARVLIKTGIRIGGFDARRYQRIVGENADFRKFDDGLKMTLDCDAATQGQLEQLLDAAVGAGTIRYGLHAQSDAMMTCIVPSILTDDHVHFVDGAAGGYTAAAAAITGC